MRITSKGQVTIPQEIRERFGFLPLTDLEFVVEGERVWLRKPKVRNKGGLVARMRGRATAKLSTEEILRLTREPS